MTFGAMDALLSNQHSSCQVSYLYHSMLSILLKPHMHCLASILTDWNHTFEAVYEQFMYTTAWSLAVVALTT